MSTETQEKDHVLETADDHQGQYGSGPGLQDPDDPVMNSESRNQAHLNKAANAVGAGPTVRRPSEHQRQDGETSSSTQSKEYLPHSRRERAIARTRSKLGLQAEAPILEGHEVHNHLLWSRIRTTLREPFAEFFGTFIMVLFGNGSVAQVLLSTGQTSAPGGNGFGAYQSISWGYTSPPPPPFKNKKATSNSQQMGTRSNARNLRRRRLRRFPKPCHNILLLLLPQTPLAPLPHLLPRAIPRRLLRFRRRVRKLPKRNKQFRRPWDPHCAAGDDGHRWYFLHVPAGVYDEGGAVFQ